MKLLSYAAVEARIVAFLNRTGLPLDQVTLVNGKYPQWIGAVAVFPRVVFHD